MRKYQVSFYTTVLISLLTLIVLIGCNGDEVDLIIFTSDRNGNLDLYSINPLTKEESNLTSSSIDEFEPLISPDNSTIAFLSRENGKTTIETLKMVGESKDRIRITQEPGNNGSHQWDPSGNRIAFLLEHNDSKAIYTINLLENRPVRLTTVKADEVGEWSPNGEYLLFTVYTGDRKGIYKRNPDGVNEERLTTESDSSPIWSPDSKKIAFISLRDGNKEIYVMNSDGLEARRLTNNDAAEKDIAWSPNGNRIAFVSEIDGNNEIYSIRPDGSDKRRLTINSIRDESPVWSNDSSKIAFISYLDDDSEIVIMNADGSNQRRLTNNDFNDRNPQW
tara:strand:- start:235 stop:1236 length:1002 start_codon:yes stop_codon:yes gene_type:complete